MATKKQARITLVGPLSYSVGRYRFAKNRPVVTEDMELVKYIGADPNFKVEMLEVEVEAKAKPSAPAQKPAAPSAEAEEESGEKPGLLKKAANAVKSMGKPGSPSKLTQKESKKETAHETD